MVDVDDHAPLHHLVDEHLTQREQAEGVAARGLGPLRDEFELAKAEQAGQDLGRGVVAADLEGIALAPTGSEPPGWAGV